jgi:outer membrane protein TolC
MVKHLIILTPVILGLLSIFPVNGQEIALTIDKAVEMALANNLNLQSERIGLQMKQRYKDRFWNLFIPKMTASASLSRPNEVQGYFGLPAPPHDWDMTFSFSASLTITSQIFFGIRKTFVDYDAGIIDLETAEKKLVLDVKKAFYNLILLEKNMELMRQNISTAEGRYERAKINYENGLVSEFDKLSAQVALENLKPGLQDMEIGFRSAVNAFKQLLGFERKTDIRIEGSIAVEPKVFDAEQLISGYVDNRLDIKSLKHTIESLINFKNITLTGLFPSVTFSFLADPTFQNDPFRDPWFADTESDWNQVAGNFSITISLALDGLIPGSQTMVKLAENSDSIRQARIMLAYARQGAEMEIETLVSNLEKSVKLVDTLELNVQLAERAYKLAEEAYNAGNRELLEVQNAELELQKARLEVLKEQFNYTTGLLDLEYAINSSLD